MLKKQSLTRKKMAENIKSNEAQNLNPGPASSLQTSQPDEKPEAIPEIHLKSPDQIRKDRMEVAEVLVTSSVSGTSKGFIGKTLSKLWSPFEHGSYQNSNIDMRAKYQGELERWKTANPSELKELQNATKLRVKEAAHKVKSGAVYVPKSRTYPKSGPNDMKLPEPPRPRTRFIAQPKISDGSIWKPPPGSKQKLPFGNERKEKKGPVVSRKVPPLSTLWKIPAASRKVTFASELKVPTTSTSKGKLVVGNIKNPVVKGTPGPKEKKVAAVKKVPVVPKKKLSLLIGDESHGSQISFAAVLKQSAVIPPVPGTTPGKTKKRGAGKAAVSIKEPKNVSIVQGYIQFAPQGVGFQNNTFANSWNTRDSGGDASQSLDRFQIDVDMDGFDDDEIFFQTDDTSLLVTGLRPKKPEANARKVTEVVEFPEGVHPEALRISRNSIGVLTVEQY